MKIHREGRVIVLLSVVLLLTLNALTVRLLPGWTTGFMALGSGAVMILVLRFFRVPKRRTFRDESTISAPSDGKVVVVERVQEKEFLHGDCIQISIFMSIHDVHVNYYPVEGTVAYLQYHPGKYLVARHPKSSELNERNSLGIETPYGPILVRQIAGYVARRIRCYAKVGRSARQGREMGFIKFGSRLDVFLPLDAKILVKPGDRVMGGLTPLARFQIKDL